MSAATQHQKSVTGTRDPETKPLGYKHTDVGAIPVDWEVRKLGQLGQVVRGGSPRPAGDPRYFNGTFIPWLTVAALTALPDNRLLISETVGYLTEEGAKRSRVLRPKTLIIANSGATLGVAKILAFRCCANDGIAAILEQRSGDKAFLCQYINTQTRRLREVVATGNGQPNLNTALISEIPVPFPPPLEQRAIAEALSDVDGLLGALETLIAKKRAIKQGAMQQLLTGTIRLPGFSGSWETKRLQDLLTYERPDRHIVKSAEYTERGDVPVLTANKSFILGYTDEDFGICRALPVIVFDDFTTDCKFATFPFKVKSSAIKLLRPRHGRVCLRYVFERMQLIRFPLGDHKRYYISEYQNIELPSPDYEEQVNIVSVLSDMDAEIAAMEQRRDKTHAIKQGMMQQLLTGRVRLVRPEQATISA